MDEIIGKMNEKKINGKMNWKKLIKWMKKKLIKWMKKQIDWMKMT